MYVYIYIDIYIALHNNYAICVAISLISLDGQLHHQCKINTMYF